MQPRFWRSTLLDASAPHRITKGATTGAIHSASSVSPNGTTEQDGVVARAAGQIVSGKDYSLHLGGVSHHFTAFNTLLDLDWKGFEAERSPVFIVAKPATPP